jgi:hypothetical protein
LFDDDSPCFAPPPFARFPAGFTLALEVDALATGVGLGFSFGSLFFGSGFFVDGDDGAFFRVEEDAVG